MATKITTPELFNLSSNNTAATQLPVFTTSTRPTPATSTVQVEYLVVAGGGGGGNYDGGGGGAGGYLTNYNGTPISITTSNLYTVAVGEGGVGGIKNAITSGVGGNSIFDTIISYGGGGGASDNNTGPSSDGGSGGGAAGGSNPTIGLASPPGQGYNGGNSSGNSGGGGGGASEAGNTDGQGHGGDGLSNSITGTATFYAGGGGGDFRTGGYPGGDGGGGAGSGSLPSNNGTPNTGGGGGAIGGSTSYQGGSGGSGIVILRYPTSSSLNITTTGSLVYTESTDGSDTVLQFTEGSGNFGFAANNITVGEMIFNSTTGKVEYWDGFQWNVIKDEIAGESPYNNVIYTGSTSPHVITGVGFQPDLIWIKDRDTANSHAIVDSIRGITSPAPYIASNTTDPQFTSSNMPTSVQSDGFTITGNGGRTNTIGTDYVAWCFKAGGAAVTNTNGTTSSQVSANVNGGFSIVKTSGTSGQITFGHGLNTAPEMIINKGITSSGWSWLVYHKDIGTGKYIKLNSTNAPVTNAGSFSSVTSTTITNNSSGSSSDYINYCFASIPNYSKVGSFIGTGASGNKIVTGFEPAFVMWKNADNSASNSMWFMFDNKRGASAYLMANSASIEGSDASIQFHTDGFTVPNAGAINNINQTHIYLAFA